MSRQPRHRRNPFTNLLPLVAGALLAATAIVACERPQAGRASSPERFAGTDTRNGGTAPAVEQAQPPTTSPPPVAAPYPPAEALSDTAITGRIRSAILTDPAMGGAEISVNTDGGVVVLAGVVKSQEQTAIASAHAQRQDGVLRVENHLTPKPQ